MPGKRYVLCREDKLALLNVMGKDSDGVYRLWRKRGPRLDGKSPARAAYDAARNTGDDGLIDRVNRAMGRTEWGQIAYNNREEA